MSKYDAAWLNEKTGEIHSPKARMVWPTLFEAKVNRTVPGSKPKFNVTLLIPKSANIDLLMQEVVRAAAETHGKDWKKLKDANKLRLPLVKTTEELKLAEFAEEYPYVLKASANEDFPPFVFGPDAKRTNDRASAYSGRWAVVAGGAWGYTTGSLGVGWNLNRIQLLDHDESIAGGRVETAEGFEAVNAAGSAPGGGGKDVDIFG